MKATDFIFKLGTSDFDYEVSDCCASIECAIQEGMDNDNESVRDTSRMIYDFIKFVDESGKMMAFVSFNELLYQSAQRKLAVRIDQIATLK